MSASQVSNAVSTDADPELLRIDVSASTADPAQAARVADAVAQAYQDVTLAGNRAAAQVAAEELQPTLDAQQTAIAEAEQALAANPEGIAERSALESLQGELDELENRVRSLQLDAAVFGSGVEFVEQASIPGNPVAPQPTRNAALFAVLGAVLGCAVAYWQAGREQKASGANDAAAILGAPMLGEVPEYRVDERGAVSGQLSAGPEAAEAYQIVLQSIEFALQEVSGSSVLITSVAPGDGKTLTALQLSLAAARDGRRVVLIDGDVRMRGLSKLLGIQRNPGLTELTVQEFDVDDCLRGIPVSDHLELPVMPAGGRLEQTTSFFRGSGFRKAMMQVRNRADLVMVDSPPLLAVADSSVIAGQVDGLVLVVNRGTPLQQLAQVRQRLDFVATPLLGYVFNRSESSMTPYYGESMDTRKRRRGRPVAPVAPQSAARSSNGHARRTEQPTPVGSRVDRTH